jgi:hypothetical protein
MMSQFGSISHFVGTEKVELSASDGRSYAEHPNDETEPVENQGRRNWAVEPWRRVAFRASQPPVDDAAHGSSTFASRAGPLEGNHFITIVSGQDRLTEFGNYVLGHGAQSIDFDTLD